MPTKFTDTHVLFYKRDSVFSNHHPARFCVNGVWFEHVEQFYIYCKLLILGDQLMAEAVLREPNPVTNKKQAHASVYPHDSDKWREKAINIMRKGVYEKFRQNPHLLRHLIATSDKVIVEASANKFWGCGIDIDDPDVMFDNLWRGRNELGKVLMYVRELLK